MSGKYEELLKDDTMFKLLDIIYMYNQASQKFLNKVDTGKARSVETYNDFIECNKYRIKVFEELGLI